MKGLVTKKQANKFWVESNQTFVCTAQKKLKSNGIFVGDFVGFDEKENQILKLLPRKNKLLRPPVANIDALVILITSAPQPDFYLLDKLLLFCGVNGIQPIICHSKSDLEKSYIDELKNAYGKHFVVLEISSKRKLGLEKLISNLEGKTCALAGQSGVGKSALLNALTGGKSAEEGELSAKIERGKNTTRHSQLFKIKENTFVADTAGFSSLDETYLPIKAEELAKYYPEFVELLPKCKFSTCTHTHEPDCAVLKAIKDNQISQDRYNRYIQILENLKQKPYR
ncbi:MAG: ribosome small subunit-dependent GTPase A [Clostridia bacterium]|nr:ribosome small subunit-dependent GTPase A [Clostridia bacterium]